MPRILRAAGALCVFALALAALGQIPVPPLKGRVTDLTATLSDAQRAALEQTLAVFEARKGSQVAVLIVPSTKPETIEQYAVRVEEIWKLGRKGVDDGVLLLIAKDDRRVRIEVGYGLEGALNDATAKRIIEDEITPRFRQGDYYGGILAGIARVIKVIDGEPLPPRGPPTASQVLTDHLDWLIPGLIVLLMVQSVLRTFLGRFFGSTVSAGAIGMVVWLIIGSLAAAVVAGLLSFVFGLFAGRLPFGALARFGGGGSSSGGGLGGGWSSGGGGFSGGGGGSGGGGASGSW